MTPEVKKQIEQIRHGIVPEGYTSFSKLIIPNGWESERIGNIARLSSGSTPSRKNPKYWDGTIPWVTTGELDQKFITTTAERITQDALDDTALKIYPSGTLLMAMYGQGKTRGTTAILGIDATINQACLAISTANSSVKYLYYTLQHSYHDIRKLSNTGNQENLNADIIRNFPILWAPESEQYCISQILTAQDRVIELKEKLLAEKQRQKKYLMQQLLTGKKRLPGFDGEWKQNKLGKLFAERSETKCEHLELLAITGTQGVIPRSQLDLKDNSSEDKSKYLHICIGDIGYNTMRMWQGVSAYSNYDGIVSPAYTILKPSSDINAKYFAYLFKMPDVVFLFYRFSQGLVDDTRNLKYANFKKISVTYPGDKEEQNAIVAVLEKADLEIDLLRQSIEQEKQKKKALMQLLLTGIVRVKT